MLNTNGLSKAEVTTIL
jgi:hypothetical protein